MTDMCLRRGVVSTKTDPHKYSTACETYTSVLLVPAGADQ